MKNIYKRAGLKLFEDDPARLSEAAKACKNQADREAVEGILCVPERKAVYDRTVRTIRLIDKIQRDVSIEPGSDDAISNEFAEPVARTASNGAQTSESRQPRYWAGFVVFVVVLLLLAASLIHEREAGDVEIIVLSDESGQTGEQTQIDTIETWREPYHVTAETLNVRSTPGVDGEVVAQVNRFDDLQVEFPYESDDWAKITTEEGTEGYVALDLLPLAEAPAHTSNTAPGR
jgi:hypothetical protein